MRTTVAPASRRHRKKWLKQAKGFWGDRRGHNRQGKNAVMKALFYSTEHRKLKKREFRSLWITRLSVAAKMCGISYSKMICGLKRAGCEIDRKTLSEFAVHDMASFKTFVDVAKNALSAPRS